MNKYIEYKEKLFHHLNNLRTPVGMFRASTGKHYYGHVWFRDVAYCALAYIDEYQDMFIQTMHTWLDAYKMYEDKYGKFTWLIKEPAINNETKYRFINPRVNADTLDEESDEWGTIQKDCLQYLIILVKMGIDRGYNIIRDDSDRYIIQLCIDVMVAMDFVTLAANDCWEESPQVFTSTLGLMMKALQDAKTMGFNVDNNFYKRVVKQFYISMPHESDSRNLDLTLLFLPFFNITEDIETRYIIRQIELNLVREYGVIRYIGDVYAPTETQTYHDLSNPNNSEMEWCFGFAYLSCIYSDLGEYDISKYYLDKLIDTWSDGMIPEGVINGEPCINRCLAWCNAMTIIAINKLLKIK